MPQRSIAGDLRFFDGVASPMSRDRRPGADENGFRGGASPRSPAAGDDGEMRWVRQSLPIDGRAVIATPFGKLGIAVTADAVHAIEFLDPTEPEQVSASVFLSSVLRELEAYLRDPRHRLVLPLSARGSCYQRRVWDKIAQIEAGEVHTYGALARQISSGARAVGGACRANPWPIVIPCHRVVATRGLGGFAGDSDGSRLAVKRWLLAHEGVCVDDPARSRSVDEC